MTRRNDCQTDLQEYEIQIVEHHGTTNKQKDVIQLKTILRVILVGKCCKL